MQTCTVSNHIRHAHKKNFYLPYFHNNPIFLPHFVPLTSTFCCPQPPLAPYVSPTLLPQCPLSRRQLEAGDWAWGALGSKWEEQLGAAQSLQPPGPSSTQHPAISARANIFCHNIHCAGIFLSLTFFYLFIHNFKQVCDLNLSLIFTISKEVISLAKVCRILGLNVCRWGFDFHGNRFFRKRRRQKLFQ